MTDEVVDHRKHPELYRVARGEQGVFQVEPYRSEILPSWRFATPDDARESSAAIVAKFEAYLAAGDFVGADMARKYLQMGYTRARRYARHPGGRKYDGPVPADKKGVSGAHGRAELPVGEEDPVKAESARIAAMTASRNTTLCGLVLLEPQNGSARATISGWLTAHW